MEQKKKNEFINKNMFWMACGLLLVFFVYVFCVTFIDIPEKNQKYVDIILGFLSGTTVANIISYYYGTSNSSQQKDKNLDDMMEIHKNNVGTIQQVELKNEEPIGVVVTEQLPFDPGDLPKSLDPDAE